jgi:hypothetical protein
MKQTACLSRAIIEKAHLGRCDQPVAEVGATQDKKTCTVGCPEIYSPICGSDGKTYENDCKLSQKNCLDDTLTVTKVSVGECPPVGKLHIKT